MSDPRNKRELSLTKSLNSQTFVVDDHLGLNGSAMCGSLSSTFLAMVLYASAFMKNKEVVTVFTHTFD